MKNNTFNGFPLLLKSKILNMAYKIPPYFFPGSSPTTSFSSLKSFLSPTIAQGLCIHTFHNSEILCLPFYLIPTQSSDEFELHLEMPENLYCDPNKGYENL